MVKKQNGSYNGQSSILYVISSDILGRKAIGSNEMISLIFWECYSSAEIITLPQYSTVGFFSD